MGRGRASLFPTSRQHRPGRSEGTHSLPEISRKLRSVRGGGPASDGGNDDHELPGVEVAEDAVAADPTASGGRLPLETGNVPREGILLEGDQSSLNADLVSWRQPSEVFLRGAGDLQLPSHGGVRSRIRNRHEQRRLVPDGWPRVPSPMAKPQGNGSQNRRAAPRGRALSECGIRLCTLSRIPRPSLAARRWSWCGWFSVKARPPEGALPEAARGGARPASSRHPGSAGPDGLS